MHRSVIISIVSAAGMFVFANYCQAVLADGYCYLEHQTNHEGTKVLFQGQLFQLITDSTYTNSSGYYQIDVPEDNYNITFTHDGYLEATINAYIFEVYPPNLPDVTLTYIHPTPDTVWTRTLGGSQGEEVAGLDVIPAGGFILVGNTESFGISGQDIWLIKTDEQGNTVWDRTFDFVFQDEATNVQHTEDGGYIIGATTYDTQGGKIKLVKTNDQGLPEWDTTLTGTCAVGCGDVIQTADGGFAVTGDSGSGYYSHKAVLIKTDASGLEQWSHTYDGYSGFGACVQQTLDSGFIITGYCYPGLGSSCPDLLVIKTSSNGETEWSHTFGDPGYPNTEVGNCVRQTSDGGYIIVGEGTGFISTIWLIKLDALGNMVWNNAFTPRTYSWGTEVRQTEDNGFIIVGSGSWIAADDELVLLKTDSSGAEEWTLIMNGPNDERGETIDLTNSGGYIISGTTNSFGAGESDIWLLRFEWNATGFNDYAQRQIPSHFIFSPPHPNPFNPSTAISYELRIPSYVNLVVYNLSGQLVTTLVKGWYPAGPHQITFDGSDLPSGIYLARLTAGDFTQVQKLVLLK